MIQGLPSSTAAPRAPGLGAWGRGLVVLAGLAGLLWAMPVPAQVRDSLPQAELDYQAAVSNYEAAVAAREAVRERSANLLGQVEQARRSGSQSAYVAAQQQYWSHIPELERLDRRVADTRARVEESRRAFLRALDRRRETVEDRLLSSGVLERNGLLAQIRDLENQYDEVERDREAHRSAPVFSPVELDPRDGPTELRVKADVLERRAQETETQIAEMTREIERLEGRLRLERQRADFQAPLDRFDANRVPVGPQNRNRTPQGEGVASEPSAVPLSELPLSQRIERMKEIRIQLESQRDLFRERAQSFRDRIRGTP